MRWGKVLLAAGAAAVALVIDSGADASIDIRSVKRDRLAAPLNMRAGEYSGIGRWRIRVQSALERCSCKPEAAQPFRFDAPALSDPAREFPEISPEKADVSEDQYEIPWPWPRPDALVSLPSDESAPRSGGSRSRMEFGATMLAPFAHTRFCLNNPNDGRYEIGARAKWISTARVRRNSKQSICRLIAPFVHNI
jgi:hypothetical protein